MKKKLLLQLDIQYFNDDLPVDGEPSSVEGEGVATPQGEPTNDLPLDSNIDTNDIENSKSFAKRLEERTQAKLAEERQKWEEEVKSKVYDPDKTSAALNYIMKQGGYDSYEDFVSAIEEAQLQERAAKENVPPEYLERVEKLEERAKLADELEEKYQRETAYKEARKVLETFASEKGIDADKFQQFVVDNEVFNLDVAYRAYNAENLEKQLAQAKELAVKEYLESKKAPKVEGNSLPAAIPDAPALTFDQARERALARMRAANTQE